MNKRIKTVDSRLRPYTLCLALYETLPDTCPIELIHLIYDFAVYTDPVDHSEYDGEWAIIHHVLLRHGQGLQTFANGDWKKGIWKKGKFSDGRGVITKCDTKSGQNVVEKGIWDKGDCTLSFDGKWDSPYEPYSKGTLRYTLVNGADFVGKVLYDGELWDHYYHGHGMYETDTVKFIGEYQFDYKQGKGSCIYKKYNTQYEGEFVHNRFHGKGCFSVFEQGKMVERYEGDFVSNNIVSGTYTNLDLEDHVIYRGSFQTVNDQWMFHIGQLTDKKTGLVYDGRSPVSLFLGFMIYVLDMISC